MHDRFLDRTVIAVVHKLESALDDFDQVAVLDGGKLSEFGPPRELAKKGPKLSAFAAMYENLVAK